METAFVAKIVNDGPKITETNYWESEYAKYGFLYMSINAGCYRLLIPKFREDFLKEMATAKDVVISRGPSPNTNPPKADAFEILFDDHTDSPFSIVMGPEQWDRIPSDSDHGWKGKVHIYFDKSKGPVMEFYDLYYRRVKKLPWLKPAPPRGE